MEDIERDRVTADSVDGIPKESVARILRRLIAAEKGEVASLDFSVCGEVTCDVPNKTTSFPIHLYRFTSLVETREADLEVLWKIVIDSLDDFDKIKKEH